MPDMREGGWGTAACYLTVERLALQAGVESPFWDGASLLMGGCEETWYKKPLTPRRLRSFIKLRRKVPTRKHKLGMDTAVCRAQSKEAAVAQLLPEMRDCVEFVSQRWAMRDCYPNPKGILRDEVI